MKLLLRALMPLLAWGVLWPLSPALAQTCSQTNTFDYRTIGPNSNTPAGNTTGTRKGTGVVGNAGAANTFTDTTPNTSITFNNYVKVGANATTVTNNFLVGTNVNLGTNQTLLWQLSYPTTETVPNNQARVTLTFSRAVDNLKLTMEDIDYAGAGGTWRDDVTFNGYTTVDANGVPTGAPVALTSANFTFAATPSAQYLSGNEVQGSTNNAAGGANGDVTVTFPTQSIRAITLIFKNTIPITGTADRVQIIGLKSASFCAQADVATSITPSVSPATSGQALSFNVGYINNGTETAAAYTQTLQLSASLGAGNVTFSNLPTGVTAAYNNGTGVVTFTGSPTTLANGANQNLTVNIAAVPFGITSIAASTTVGTSTDQGPDTGANSASSTVVVQSSDVTSTLTGPAYLNAGQASGTYTATFTNNGPSTASNLTRKVALPNGATLTTAQQNTITAAYAGTTFATAGGVTTITFPTATNVTSGGSSSFNFVFTAPGTTGANSLTSTAGTASNQGANTAADAATLTVQVNAAAPAACTPSYYDNTNTYSGLSGDYYSGNYNNDLTYFNNNTAKLKRIDASINFPNNTAFGDLATSGVSTATGPVNQNFSARYRGSFTIATAGSYTFTSDIDDNLQVWVDGNAIPTTGAPQTTAFTPTLGNAIINVPNYSNGLGSSAAIPLSAGPHNILIFFGAGGGANNLTLKYSGPDTGNSAVLVPNSALCAGPSNVPPTAIAVTNPAIPSNSGPTTISSLNGSDFESTGSVAKYAIATLPANGTLRLNGTAVTAGQVITAAEAATLTFQPAANFVGSTSFTFSAIDNTNQYSNTTATFTIPVNAADVTTTITGPATLNQGQTTGTYTATFTNNGPADAANVTQQVTLPAGAGLTTTQLAAIRSAYPNTTYTASTRVLYFGGASVSLANATTNTFNFAFTAPTTTTGATTLASAVTTTTGQGANTAADAATLTITVNAAAPNNCAVSYFNNTTSYGGLSAEYYPGNYNGDPTFFNTTTSTEKNVAPTLDYNRSNGSSTFPITNATLAGNANASFSARYRGNINIATAGSYTISTFADDRTQVWIDGEAVPASGTPATGTTIINTNFPTYAGNRTLTLSAGPHNILLYYYAFGQPDTYSLSYSGPDTGGSTVIIPNSVLCAGLGNVPPTSIAVTNPAIPGNSGPTTISALNGSDFETSGSVTNYAIATLPANGTLRLNGTAVTAGQVITAAQAATLTFQPAANFVGSTSFTFSAIDNSGQYSNTTATYTLPVNAADVATTISGPATLTGNVATANNAFTATFSNSGPAAAANVTRIITLPPGATMTAAQVTASGGTYTAPASNTTSGTLDFGNLSTLASGGSSSFSFGFVPFNGGSSPVSTTSTITTTTAENGATANNTRSQSSTVKFTPVPAYVTSASISSTAGSTAISALSATDQDGTVASYTIATIPANSQGVLYYNNAANGTSGTYVAVTGPLTLTPAQAGTLRFDPNGSTFGNVTFTYTATDNEGNPSTTASSGGTQVQGPAVFTIPLSNGGISANNDSNTVPLNTAKTGNVLLNDYNPDNTGLAVALAGAATAGGTTTTYSGGTATTAHGTVTITATGAYTYTPNTGYLGSDTFAYQVCNSSGTGCTTALVTLRVYDPGTACTSGTGPNLLINPDFNQGNTGFVSDYMFVTKPSPLVMNVNGLYPTFTYAVDANAQDYHFAFTGTGHTSATNPSDQFMMLNGAASVARIYSQAVTVLPNHYYTFSAYLNNLGNGNKAVPEVGFIINGEGTSGTRMITETPDRWVLASDIWYSGANTSATFEIRNLSTDASGNDFAIDDVYFGTCNLAPIANNDLRTTPVNTAITFSATANDTDGDGAVVPGTFLFSNGTTSISVTGGSFTVDGSGNVTFTPTTGFTGTATATYTVKDNNTTPSAATSNPGTISVTVGPPPVDLSTAIAASAATVNAGATETLTVTASNNGPTGTATNVTQTVQLPAGLSNVTFGTPTVGAGATLAAGSASYNSATGLVTFPVIASQATGATGNVAYTVSFNAPANGPFTATANVASANNSDTNPANNAASTTIAVNPQFDLVTTLNGPNTAVQGTLITYTVSSANNGPSIAPNAVQTVTGLPAGLGQVFVSNGGTYNSASGTVTFPAIASFASGQAVANSISFVAPASGTTITPVATLTPNTTGAGETNATNNTAALNGVTNGATATTAGTTTTAGSVTTTDQANLRVSVLTTSASSVAAGTAVTVNVTFKNDGPNSAAGVTYQLSLTPGTVITSALPTGASYNSATGIVTFNAVAATLATGSTQPYALTFTAPNVGPVLVAASVSSSLTADPVPADNFASTKVEIQPSANVGTTIAGPATALAGQSVNYAVTTFNNGAAAAQNVTQTVALPGGLPAATLLLNGATGSLNTGTGIVTFTGGATYNVSTGLLTLPTLASAAAGSSSTNEITFVAPAGVASYSATAAVTSTTPDAALANNTATATTTVTPSVDVRTLVSGPASVPVLSPLTLSVTTLNDGPSVATTVAPTLQLPANLANVVLPTGASYSSTTGLVTFATISNLASGAAVTNSVSFTMPDVAQVTALATSTVSGGAVDRNVDNNRVSFTTTSTTPTDLVADLSATVTSSAASVAAGSPVTLTLTIANGPALTSDAASNIRPVLALPAGLNVTTLQVGGQTGSYNGGTGVVTFPGGATYNVNTGQVIFPVVSTLVASDASGYAPLTYTVTLTAPGIDPLVATASVTSATSDPAPANNQQTLPVTVTQAADLVTSISGPASAVATGSAVTYAVTTTNNGATPAASATTTVVLPIANGASYSVNGGTAQTYNGTSVTLPVVTSQQPGANGSVTNTISFTSPSGTPGSTFAVTATASTTTTETSTANNGSSATTTRANQVPVAQNVVNSLQAPEGNTAGPLRISPLTATDADGTVATYQLTGSLPASSQGVLYYNNNTDGTSGTFVALPIGQNLTQAQANTLRFDPATTYAGNVLFSYTATDNLGAVSAAALYTIPVATDVLFTYKTTPVKGGGANQYQNGNVLAYGIDPNGAAYNTAGLVYNADGSTATGTVNNGIRMGKISVSDSTTLAGKGIRYTYSTGLFTVVDRTLLPRAGFTIPVSVTTVDLFGGITTQTVTLVLGQNPLPVELTDFTATAVKNVDAALVWHTASERNNDHFDVERSLNGTDYVKIAEVRGQGSKSSPTDYALTDAGIGPKATGTVYYRLKQVDAGPDATATYSPVRTVAFAKSALAVAPAIGLYPNPATSATQLDLTQLPAGTYQVRVLDATGRVVLAASREAGLAQSLELNTLASGTYTLLVSGQANGQVVHLTKRLIKE